MRESEVAQPMLCAAPMRLFAIRWIPPLLVLLGCAHASAQCTLEGSGVVREVRPDGTQLRVTVRQEVRVALNGRQASVEGARPIAFRGRARSRDVEAYLRNDVTVGEVLRVLAATPVVVERAGEALAVRFDFGSVQARTTLPCDALSLTRTESAQADAPVESGEGEHVLARGPRLRLYADSGARRPALELRLSPDGQWPLLEVRGHERRRLRVHVSLGEGATAEAWVDARDVRPPSEDGDAGTCDCPPAPLCGRGHGGAISYRGPAIVAGGSQLLDGASGRAWARVVGDTPASITIASGAVHVGSIAGIELDECDPADIRVATTAVRIQP